MGLHILLLRVLCQGEGVIAPADVLFKKKAARMDEASAEIRKLLKAADFLLTPVHLNPAHPNLPPRPTTT